MKAVILAGGLGTRLSEETSTRPKPMVEIGGKPILWHIMKTYSSFGYKDFQIALGYKAEIVKEYFLNYQQILNNYKLFVGIREKKDIADSDIFSEDKSFYSISREKDLYQNNHYKGRVNAQLKNIEFIENYQNSIYMICGNSYMISDVYDILVKEKNINPNSIITESFF